jgi:Predicted membrane protein (DUF2142)
MSDPARFFAAASLFFGALFIILTPPFRIADEPAHLFRAWSISEGTLFAHGGARVPRSIVSAAAAGLARPFFERTTLRPDDRIFLPVVADSWRQRLSYTAPGYTPLGYAATAPAIAAGRAFSLPPITLVYLGRVANLLASTLILAVAVRRAPFGRWALALLALTPMVVFMRASLAVDALTIACAVGLTVEIARAAPASSIALSFVVAAIKPGYALLPLLAFGVARLRARPMVMAMIGIATLAGTAAAWIWIREAGTPAGAPPNLEMLDAPFAYAMRLARELGSTADLIAVEMVAAFGWLDALAPLAFALIWIAAVIGVAIIDGPPSGFNRAWSLTLFIVSVAAIATIVRIYSPGPKFLSGLQGRYFLPCLPLAVLPLCTLRGTERAKRFVAVGVTALAVAQSAWTLVQRYWV